MEPLTASSKRQADTGRDRETDTHTHGQVKVKLSNTHTHNRVIARETAFQIKVK